MLIRGLTVVAAFTFVGGAAALVIAVAGDWGAPAVVALAIAVAIGAALLVAVAVAVTRRVLRLLVSTQTYARLSSERTAAIRAAGSQASVSEVSGGTTLVLALGEAADSDDLERFIRSNGRGDVVLMTDRGDVVSRLARDVVVEFLPAIPGSAESRIAQLAARIVEVAAEARASALVVWPEADEKVVMAGAETADLALVSGSVLRSLLQVDREVRRRLADPSGAISGPTAAALARDVVAKVTAQIDELSRASDRQRERAIRELRADLDDLYRQIESLAGLYRFFDGDPGLPPLRGWAVSPDLGLDLVEMVVSGSIRNVLEVGSGTSTVLFAMAFERVGDGHVTTLDHDTGYAARTRALLERYGVAHRATVHDAPLVATDVAGESYRWYDIDGLELPTGVDMLFVDGPPEAAGSMSRFPALPLLASCLADTAVVVLDDGRRHDEIEIVERWSRRDDIEAAAILPHERKPALLRYRRPAGSDVEDG